MKVIIFGVTGYNGLPVANALVRNGHVVIGVSRNEKSKKIMLENEVIPVIGDPLEASTWSEHIADADVAIDCVAGDISKNGELLYTLVCEAASKKRTLGVPKLAYIYMSGTWVHGDNRSTLAHRSDGSPLPNPPMAIAWRPALEQKIIQGDAVRGIVVRPSVCYGRGGSLTRFLFDQGGNQELSWFGTAGGAMAMIHVDDLAEAMLLAVEKNHLISGLILDVTAEFTESVDGILHSFAALVGIPPEKISYRPCANPLEDAMSVTCRLRPSLARSLLGWAPHKASFTDGMATYYEAWKAVQTGSSGATH